MCLIFIFFICCIHVIIIFSKFFIASVDLIVFSSNTICVCFSFIKLWTIPTILRPNYFNSIITNILVNVDFDRIVLISNFFSKNSILFFYNQPFYLIRLCHIILLLLLILMYLLIYVLL